MNLTPLQMLKTSCSGHCYVNNSTFVAMRIAYCLIVDAVARYVYCIRCFKFFYVSVLLAYVVLSLKTASTRALSDFLF